MYNAYDRTLLRVEEFRAPASKTNKKTRKSGCCGCCGFRLGRVLSRLSRRRRVVISETFECDVMTIVVQRIRHGCCRQRHVRVFAGPREARNVQDDFSACFCAWAHVPDDRTCQMEYGLLRFLKNYLDCSNAAPLT